MDYKDYNDNELLMYINESDETAYEIMYKKYEPIIKEYALKLLEKGKLVGMELNDLIQEGMLGLGMAIEHYKDQYDTSFYTFAKTCIQRKMLSSIVREEGLKNLPLNKSISFDFYGEDAYKSNYYLGDTSNIPENVTVNTEYIKLVLNIAKDKLSTFEKQILSLKIKGYRYTEISKYLNKDYKTIDNAIQRIRMKLKNITKELN